MVPFIQVLNLTYIFFLGSVKLSQLLVSIQLKLQPFKVPFFSTALIFPFYEDHTIGDHSGAASSSLVCPYLALRGFLHPVHVPSTSNSGAESTSFHRHSTGLEGHATPDLSNAQVFHATESRNHDSEHRHLSNLPVSGIPDHSMAPFGIGLPRYDNSSQQRSRSFARHHPLIHRYSQFMNLILNRFVSFKYWIAIFRLKLKFLSFG